MTLLNIKNLATNGKIDDPMVIKSCTETQKWKISALTPKKLAEKLGNQLVNFRIGTIKKDDIQWENECQYIKASMSEFLDWNDSKFTSEPFSKLDRSENWAYADYIYIKDLFKNVPDFKFTDEIDWTLLGFDPDEGLDAAIWVGTKSSHTACHYDSYGFNLVYQVFGRKRWILFPPSDSENVYPTRLPYEESSVFSQVNMLNPDVNKHKRFSRAHPYIVTLEPGDLLFVPHHWWHFVENLELSISINAWFPLEQDYHCRLHEAVTQLLIQTVTQSDPSLSQWLISKHQTPTFNEGLSIVEQALTTSEDFSIVEKTDRKTAKSSETPKKCLCNIAQRSAILNTENCYIPASYCIEHLASVFEHWTHVKSWNQNALKEARQKRCRLDRPQLTSNDFARCLTAPSVVECIVSELYRQFE
uniref:HSPB1-associated protein 1 n=1 Tax=Phallusia mammillata TaxID=59560 RepID=A0A6F9DET8_9ASCI|nr:HSPB1-associated protein 1 [Phallusia mammillata]